MGQAKLKQQSAFSPELIQEWESEDCVNFAIGLARLTGWLIHVDWWETQRQHREDITENELQPLRVYVGDNGHRIFDVRGIKTIFEFNARIIGILAQKIAKEHGGVRTKFYEEKKLTTLPLRFSPNEEKIEQAMLHIQANKNYLSSIPTRDPQSVPAWKSAEFSYGLCVPYAEALKDSTGLETVALLAKRFSPNFEGTIRGDTGYFHSVVLHASGMGEDSWGIATLDEIADRFGVIDYEISATEHRIAVENLIRNSGDKFLEAKKEAKDTIAKYRQ